jgi:hypothetical protein
MTFSESCGRPSLIHYLFLLLVQTSTIAHPMNMKPEAGMSTAMLVVKAPGLLCRRCEGAPVRH